MCQAESTARWKVPRPPALRTDKAANHIGPSCGAVWGRVRDRIRPGGLYVCNKVLWSGHFATDAPSTRPGFEGKGYTEAIVAHNRAIADDPDFLSVIIPTRDGLLCALRTG